LIFIKELSFVNLKVFCGKRKIFYNLSIQAILLDLLWFLPPDSIVILYINKSNKYKNEKAFDPD